MKKDEVVGVISLVGLVVATTYLSVIAFEAIKKHYEQLELDKELDIRRSEKAAEKARIDVAEQSDEDNYEEHIDDNEVNEEDAEETYEEMEKLRYDKNSREAWDQYVEMKLAEFNGEDLDTMRRLYKKEFVPNERIDENGIFYHEVIDQHTEFFGEDSKYNTYFTVGDLVIYWAYKLNWDLGDDDNYNIVYFAKLILDRSGLGETIMNDSPSHFQDLVDKIQDNKLYNINSLHADDEKYIEVTLFGIFQVDEDDLRNDLPSSLSEKPLSDISMLRQFWTAETQLMSNMESEKGEGYEDYSDENLDD